MMEKIIFARWIIIGVDASDEVIIRENEGLVYRANKILEIGEYLFHVMGRKKWVKDYNADDFKKQNNS